VKVGQEWVSTLIGQDAKLELLTTTKVQPLLKRYLSAIKDSNPDKQTIRRLKDLLTDRPLISRYEFLKSAASTLSETLRAKVTIGFIRNIVTGQTRNFSERT
jgi:hypothetical protein